MAEEWVLAMMVATQVVPMLAIARSGLALVLRSAAITRRSYEDSGKLKSLVSYLSIRRDFILTFSSSLRAGIWMVLLDMEDGKHR